MLKFLILLLWLLLSGCSGVFAQSPTLIPKAVHILPQFESVYQSVQERSDVPVVLPTTIPLEAQIPTSDGLKPYLPVPLTSEGKFENVYPQVVKASPDYYEISLDALPNCEEKRSCAFGVLAGEKLYTTTPTVQQLYQQAQAVDYQPVARSPETQGEVSLKSGITGYFVPFVCGANCDTSKIFWEQEGYRYWVGIRYASRATMIKMANSVILNQQD